MRCEELVAELKAEYPRLNFRVNKKFSYRPPRTICYETDNKICVTEGGFEQKKATKYVSDEQKNAKNEQNWYLLQLLHELGHALSGHVDFRTDVDRVRMEREAWERARELCEKYEVDYDEEYVEIAMDSYRDWLHRRSRCVKCGETRYQTADGRYHCAFCENFGLK